MHDHSPYESLCSFLEHRIIPRTQSFYSFFQYSINFFSPVCPNSFSGIEALTKECLRKLKTVEDEFFAQAEVIGVARVTAEQMLFSNPKDLPFRSPSSLRNLDDVTFKLSPLADRPLSSCPPPNPSSPPPLPPLKKVLPLSSPQLDPLRKLVNPRFKPYQPKRQSRSDKGKKHTYTREPMGKCSNCGSKRALSNLSSDPFELNNNSLFCNHCLLHRAVHNRNLEERAWDNWDGEAREFVESSDFEDSQ